MIAQQFEYTAPKTLDEALHLLAAGAKPLAGGMSLIPMMKLRVAAPGHIRALAPPHWPELHSRSGWCAAQRRHHDARGPGEFSASAPKMFPPRGDRSGDRGRTGAQHG